MTIEHVIVVRVRKKRLVLSVDTLHMTTNEQVVWLSEDGEPFSIHFKHGKKPFGGNGHHMSQSGAVKVTPAPLAVAGDAPQAGADKVDLSPTAGVHYNYTVKRTGLCDLDPKIVFEIPPIKPRE